MNDKENDGLISVPAHIFDAVSITVCRVIVLLEAKANEEPAGSDQAEVMDATAELQSAAIKDVLLATKAPNREAMAKRLGWPSADALVSYLFSGPSAGEG